MAELNERDILNSLAALKRLEPESTETRAVLTAVRRVWMRKRLVRWTIATGAAAAAMGIVVGLAFLTLSGRSASAATALNEAAQTSKAYQGWVHSTMADSSHKLREIIHFNIQTGLWASENRNGDKREIIIYDPTAKTETRYSSTNNMVRIGALYEEFAGQWKQMIRQWPLTVAENAALIPGTKVKELKDGEFLRYELEFPKKVRGKERPERAVIWVDRKTKLIQRGTVNLDGGEAMTFTYTYGEPAVGDVYDLGVPRDAVVVDARPPADLEALWTRLENRSANGFGDLVAVVCEQDETGGGSVILSARQGKAYLARRYLVQDPKAPQGSPWNKAPLPKNWPKPELSDVLAVLKDAMPTNYIIGDGKVAWSGFQTEPGKFHETDLTMDPGVKMVLVKWPSPFNAWPTRAAIGLYGADAKAEFITDKTKPALVGLRTTQVYPGTEMKPTRTINTFWLDPAKDDMPVESVHITYYGTTDKKYLHSESRFTAYAQTDAGQWYPSAWSSTTSVHIEDKVTTNETKSFARAWTSETLGDEWFQKPKVNSTSATSPASSSSR
jgi:hypothetical protein